MTVNEDARLDNGIVKRWLCAEHDQTDEWHEREVGEYHASTVGKCTRRLYYDFVDDTRPDASAYPHFQLGHVLEEQFLSSLKEEFGDRYVKTDIPIEIQRPEYRIVGETDPVVINDNFELEEITECKTTGNLKYVKGAPKRTHKYQVHCYMKALGQDEATIIYLNKYNLDSVMHTVEFDAEIWADIIDRMDTLHEALLEREPPEPFEEPKYQDHFCDHEGDKCCKNL